MTTVSLGRVDSFFKKTSRSPSIPTSALLSDRQNPASPWDQPYFTLLLAKVDGGENEARPPEPRQRFPPLAKNRLILPHERRSRHPQSPSGPPGLRYNLPPSPAASPPPTPPQGPPPLALTRTGPPPRCLTRVRGAGGGAGSGLGEKGREEAGEEEEGAAAARPGSELSHGSGTAPRCLGAPQRGRGAGTGRRWPRPAGQP